MGDEAEREESLVQNVVQCIGAMLKVPGGCPRSCALLTDSEADEQLTSS
jgi:hypothetical protein